MKKMIGWMLAAVVALSASAAYAACGSCPGDAKKAAKPACCVALEKLTLTADQKAKVAELQAECKKAGCPVEGQKKMAEGLKKILTDQQYQEWEKACAEAKKAGGCPSGKKAGGGCGAKTQ
jgi:gamma-glutamyl phosphate reductase